MLDWERFIEFERDAGNQDKNWEKHGVTDCESEEVLFNRPLVVRYDSSHSNKETRFWALGHTDLDRKLFIAFTIREEPIRIISAREMTHRERRFYVNYEQREEKT